MDENNLRILNWNVRGLNSGARREVVKLMIQQTKPMIICLQETKLNLIDSFLAMEFLGPRFSDSFQFLPADDTRGGIIVAWDPNLVEGGAADLKTFSLSLEITLRQNNSRFYLTAVYGPTEHAEKDDFLIELIASQPVLSTPWICLGDFNLICEARDKNNSNINRSLMRKFRQALDASELMEIRVQNRKYTWSNGQRNPTMEYLDRVFFNNEWADIFRSANLQALSSSLSDHSPLFLSNYSQPYRMAIFRFENF